MKKGATIDMAAALFTANAKKLGLIIHGDLLSWVCSGETRDTIRKTIDFAKRLDVDTASRSRSPTCIRVPNFIEYAKENSLVTIDMADTEGHQLPNVSIPAFWIAPRWSSG